MDCSAVHSSLHATAMASTPSICLTRERGTLAVHGLCSPRNQLLPVQVLRRGSFFIGDVAGCCLSVTAFKKKEARRYRQMETRAASKPSKPPPKRAASTTIALAIALPLLLAGGAVITGKLLVRRMHLDALEDAEELEKKFNSERLLTDGSANEPIYSAKGSESTESGVVVGTRNRPKRME